jgi:glycosyltransferase involved in cell wall biosynthesis
MSSNKQLNACTWVVIPAYNEQNTITSVIKDVCKIIPNIIVVDDASTDLTHHYLSQLPVVIIRNRKNIGYVKTLEKGLKHAFSLGADYAITFDADGQHLGVDLKQFLHTIQTRQPDLILGNRSFKNRLMEKMYSLYTKRTLSISDPFCGFRAYRKEFFSKIGNKLETHYSIGTENAFCYLTTHSISMVEINLTTAKRQDESRFAGKIKGNLLELYSAINLFWYVHVSK